MNAKTFLTNSEHTGRFILHMPNGKKYYIEPIDNKNHHALFGDINPATNKVEGSYGEKFRGSVNELESLISESNGFSHIFTLPPGVSPIDYIEQLNKQYEQSENHLEKT